MSDINLYTQSPDTYDALQNKRPDYFGAKKAFIELATKYLKNKQNILVIDFCCGIGADTKILANNVSVNRATLVDVNKEFLNIAVRGGIRANEVVTVQSDIIEAKFNRENDVVISMFAYHHVHNNQKIKYIEQAKATLKNGGIVILGEIYTSDKQTTLDYYEYLIQSIPEAIQNKALQMFLRQTAASEDFEFKVSREFAHNQFTAAGFELLESRKIWPLDDSFEYDIGTFVEVWKMK